VQTDQQFIATVPRHGYRFIAPVRVFADDAPLDRALASDSTGPQAAQMIPASTTRHWMVALTVIIVTATALVIWFVQREPFTAPTPMRFSIAKVAGGGAEPRSIRQQRRVTATEVRSSEGEL